MRRNLKKINAHFRSEVKFVLSFECPIWISNIEQTLMITYQQIASFWRCLIRRPSNSSSNFYYWNLKYLIIKNYEKLLLFLKFLLWMPILKFKSWKDFNDYSPADSILRRRLIRRPSNSSSEAAFVLSTVKLIPPPASWTSMYEAPAS